VRPTKPFQNKIVPGQHDVGAEYRRVIGSWIKGLRVQADLTQKQLAELMDVRETAISAIETGRNTIPPERYEQLANLLNVPAQKFAVHILRYDNPWLFKMIFGANYLPPPP
jgi:transcriptional regulator with XRE-family HTH domain